MVAKIAKHTGAASLTRRSLLQGGGALLGALPLGACHKSSKSSTKATELSFWNFYAPSEQFAIPSKWFTDLTQAWNANNDVKVNLRYVPPADYFAGTVVQTAFSSGEGPDIFLISPGDFLRYYNGGVLADLTPYLSPETIADHIDGVLDTRKVDGKIYGLPMEVEPLAMYYSLQAFEKAGLSEADLPKTWDQLLAVARKLTKKDQFGVLFETTPGYYQNFTWYPFMWMGGASAVAGPGTTGFNAPGAIKALEFWQRAVQDGVCPRKCQGDGGSDAIANLASGYCAMQQTGIWSISQLAQKAPSFPYGVFRLPVPDGGTYTTAMGGWAFVANAKGRNPEAAAKFVAWALGSTGPDGAERCLQWNTVAKTNLPTRKSVYQAAERAGTFSKGPLATFMKDVVKGGRGEPRYTPEVYRVVSDAIQACQLGGSDPAKSAAEAATKIDLFLKQYQGARML